jgi:CBS-domain-containing membrane protein
MPMNLEEMMNVILVLCAVVFNNLAEERTYPKHWL